VAVALGFGGMQLASAQSTSETYPAMRKAVKELAEAGKFSKMSDREILSALEEQGLFGGDQGNRIRAEALNTIAKLRARKAGQIEPVVPAVVYSNAEVKEVTGIEEEFGGSGLDAAGGDTVMINEAGLGPFRLTSPPANALYADQFTIAKIGVFDPATIYKMEALVRQVTTTQPTILEITFWDTLDQFAPVGTSVVSNQLGPVYNFDLGVVASGSALLVTVLFTPEVPLTDRDITVQYAFRTSVGGPYAPGCTTQFFCGTSPTPTPQIGTSIEGWYMDATTANNILESNEFFDFASPNNSADYRSHLFGTTPTTEREPNDTAATANQDDCGHTLAGSISPVGDVDFYKFTTVEDDTVTVNLSGCTSDLSVTVRDSLNNVVASASGGCASPSALLSPDTYTIEVRELGDDATTPYSINIACVSTPDDEVEPNNTAATANPIASGNHKKARISPIGDVDYWTFTVAPAVGGAHITATVDCRGGDSTLSLHDASDVEIAFDDDGGVGACSMLDLCLASGTYYLVVRDFGDNNTMPYFIDLTVDTCAVDETEPNGSQATAAPIDCNGSKTGGVDFSGDSDFWTFTLASDSAVYVDVDCGGSDSFLSLQDAGGEITSDDDGGPGLCSHIETSLLAGTYYLEVSGFGSAVFSYTLSLVCDTVPTNDAEPNDDRATAVPIACGDSTPGILTSGDVDYYSFSIGSAARVNASVSVPHSGVQFVVTLQDSVGNVLASGSTGARTTLGAGSYFVAIDETSGGSSVAGYNLTLSCNTAFDSEGCIDNGHTVAGTLATGDSVASFGYSGTAGESLRIIVRSVALDVNAVLTDSSGNEVDRDDDDADGTNAQICYDVAATGQYDLLVSSSDGGSGAFTVSTDILAPVTGAESEPNNNAASADNINHNDHFLGTLSTTADKDFFKFFGGTGDVVSCSVLSCSGKDNTPNPARDFKLELQNGSGGVIASSDDEGEDFDPILTDVVLPSSTGFVYYLVVSGFTAGDYDIFFQFDNIPFTFIPSAGTTPKMAVGDIVQADVSANNPSVERRLDFKIERIVAGVPTQLQHRSNVRAPAGFTKSKTIKMGMIPALPNGTNITYRMTVTVNGRPRVLDFDVQVQTP
jgi:hypothetical protein